MKLLDTCLLSQCGGGLFISGLQFTPLGWAGLGWAGLGWAGRRYREVMAATQLSDTGIITNTNINCSNVLFEGGNLIDRRF